MDKEFLKKAVIPPLAVAFVFAIILCVYFKVNVDKFIPLYNNTQYAYHDDLAKDENKNNKNASVDKAEYKEDENADFSAFEKNECIGVIRVGKGYPIRYDMDYSRIQKAVSFVPQSVPFGEVGFTYIYSGNNVGKDIAAQKNLSVGTVLGDKQYSFKEQKSFKSEYDVLNFAPVCKSALIIYYRDSVSAGFTSEYIALVYEEVK